MDPKESALVNHIVGQITANVDFLVSQNYMSPADAQVLKSKLPATDLASRMGSMQLNTAYPTPPIPSPTPYSPAPPVQPVYSPPVAPPPRAVPAPPVKPVEKARAIWGYNEDGRDPEDLSFSAGETIEIVERTNADWWTGRARGRTALFPCNYVEIIQDAPPYSPPEKQPYKPFGAAYHGMAQPAPAQQPVQAGPGGLQENAAEQEEKKSKFGKYGNTLAHAGVGGLGFGAGSAIGSSIVHSIF